MESVVGVWLLLDLVLLVASTQQGSALSGRIMVTMS